MKKSPTAKTEGETLDIPFMTDVEVPCFDGDEDRREWWADRHAVFDREVARPFDYKLSFTHKVVKTAIEMFGDGLVVASSFGKDSTVLVDLVNRERPGIRVVFVNTGIEFSETLEQRDQLVKQLGLNLVELKPERSFFSLAREHGLPAESRIGGGGRPVCCRHLKEKPMLDYIRREKTEAIAIGLTADEGRHRRFTIIRKGVTYYARSQWKSWKVHPIVFWTAEDVWRYHEERGLPKNKAYSRYDLERCGCLPCTGHIGWEEQVLRVNPKLYKIVQKMKGQAILDV